ncbi:MAG: N-acetyl-gamma-glutamyl-phosphate reductase [Gaiellales bacterium]
MSNPNVPTPNASDSRPLAAGIAGASGYAGQELVRILDAHPAIRPAALQARSEPFDPIDADALAACDIVFLALPHGESRELGERLLELGTQVVDLGSDFRVDGWAYGLPELHREDLRVARSVANPGCYATAAILGVAPLAAAGLIDGPVHLDGKSGVTGAGRTPTEKTHLPELYNGVTPYSVTGHRHLAEIEQELGVLAGSPQPATFVPHLLPTSRGLLVTAHVRVVGALDQADLDDLYRQRYDDEPFVRLGDVPAPQRLAGSNVCWINGWVDDRTGTVLIASALDNLVKGAAGQAIQNANIMLGLDEVAGLTAQGLWP